jgi:predicted DNA-binding transcriptional regulator YafY
VTGTYTHRHLLGIEGLSAQDVLTVLDTAQLRWWLRGFGPDVEVIEPRALRDEFSADARKLAARYVNA